MGGIKQISVTVPPDISPKIENWLMGRDIYYEVEAIRKRRAGVRLKIIVNFSDDDTGNHQAEIFKRFLERIDEKGGK